MPAGYVLRPDGEYERLKPAAPGEIVQTSVVNNEDGLVKVVPVGLEIAQSTDEQKLNKTERAYLAVLRARGYPWIGIQNVTLKLGDDCRFTPDFSFVDPGGRMTFVDVKGFQRDDALVKIKAAARQFAWALFQIVSRDGNGWEIKEVKP